MTSDLKNMKKKYVAIINIMSNNYYFRKLTC